MNSNKLFLFDQMYGTFKSQDPGRSFFDVAFDIDGKKIYANKFRLGSISSTFNSMLSDRWSTKDDPIKIMNYSYEDFYQFLTFLYSGECDITDDNIYTMVDMAEYYNVELFKKSCDTFLSKMEITQQNVFRLINLSNKYSMAKLTKPLLKFVSTTITTLIESNEFMELNKSNIKDFIILCKGKVKAEELFKGVYKWAEKQTSTKAISSNDQNFDFNVSIKAEMADFMQFFDFYKMDMDFLDEFVVERGFLFSYKELSNILRSARSNPGKGIVKVTNSLGKSVYCPIPSENSVVDKIKLLKMGTKWLNSCLWSSSFKFPATPSPVKAKETVDWYLSYVKDNYLAVLHRSDFANCSNYIIADMVGSNEFSATANCKIEIV
jgi:hypothetical protein